MRMTHPGGGGQGGGGGGGGGGGRAKLAQQSEKQKPRVWQATSVTNEHFVSSANPRVPF